MSVVDVLVPSGVRAGAQQVHRRRAALALGLIGLGLWCSCAALSVSMPAFYGVDEPAHLGYVASLLDGDLPRIDDPLPRGRLGLLDRLLVRYDKAGGAPNGRSVVWVANHPPTYYVLAVPAVVVGVELAGDDGALLGMRLLSGGLLGLAAVATGALAARLVPGRPPVAVGAAALFALSAQTPQVGAIAYSDSLAVLGWVVALAAAVEVVRRPPGALTPRLVVGVAVVAALAAATRASLAPVLAAIVAAWLVAAVRASRSGHRVALAAWGAAAAIAAPAVAAGPWYLRNQHLYGSITGERRLFELFDRHPRSGLLHALRWDAWDHDVRALWAQVRPGVGVDWALWVVGGIAGLAVVVGLVRWIRAGRPASWDGAVAWMLVGGSSAGLVVAVARFVAAGGNPHIRYLLPLVPSVAVAAASGLVGRLGRPWALAAAVVVMGSIQLVLLRQWLEQLEVTRLGIEPSGTWAHGAARALLVLWGLAMLGGAALLLTSGTRPPPSEVDGRDLRVGEGAVG